MVEELKGRKLKLVTNEGKVTEVDYRVKDLSQLIFNICLDYSAEQEIKLDLSYDELTKAIEFFEILNYNVLEINRPIINVLGVKEKLIKTNEKLFSFYNRLNCEDLIVLFKISDFMDIKSLENVLYLKLLEAFDNIDLLNEFFKKDIGCETMMVGKDNEMMLKTKYIEYCKKHTESLTSEQLNDLIDELIV